MIKIRLYWAEIIFIHKDLLVMLLFFESFELLKFIVILKFEIYSYFEGIFFFKKSYCWGVFSCWNFWNIRELVRFQTWQNNIKFFNILIVFWIMYLHRRC